MVCCILVFVLASPLLASVSSQRHLPGEDEKIRIEKKTPTTPDAQPKGSRIAQKRTNGVLFVLTEPAEATVLIKARGAILKQGLSQEGEFRVELPPGAYDVQVSAPEHLPYAGKASVKMGQPQLLTVGLVPTTGSILIGPVEHDSYILVDGEKPAGIEVKKAENQIEINNVPAGFHKIRITHPTIMDWERDRIEVQGGATTYIAPKFKAAVVSLIVKSQPGAAVYVDETYKGDVTESGKTGILELSPGRHTVRVLKAEFTPSEQIFTLAPGDIEIELKLTRIVFSPEFSDFFVEAAKFWSIPAAWQVSRGNMLVRGAGVGLVKDKLYKDFTMEFDLRFVNGKGAAWVVRAQDEKNYYLFQLTGPKSGAPNTFRSYLVENGQMKLLKTDFVAEDLSRPNDSFHIILEAKSATITHSIQVKSAPRAEGPQPLSLLSDGRLTYGSIGFTALDGEEASILFVSIVPFK